MAQNVKTLKLDKIEKNCWKTCYLHKIEKIYTDILTHVFLSKLSTKKKIKKIIINIHFLQFSFQRLKLE